MTTRVLLARIAVVASFMALLPVATAGDRPGYPVSVSPGSFGRAGSTSTASMSAAYPVAVQPGWFGRPRTPSRASSSAAVLSTPGLTAGTYRNLNVPDPQVLKPRSSGGGSGYGSAGMGAYRLGGGAGHGHAHGYNPSVAAPR